MWLLHDISGRRLHVYCWRRVARSVMIFAIPGDGILEHYFVSFCCWSYSSRSSFEAPVDLYFEIFLPLQITPTPFVTLYWIQRLCKALLISGVHWCMDGGFRTTRNLLSWSLEFEIRWHKDEACSIVFQGLQTSWVRYGIWDCCSKCYKPDFMLRDFGECSNDSKQRS